MPVEISGPHPMRGVWQLIKPTGGVISLSLFYSSPTAEICYRNTHSQYVVHTGVM